MLRSQLKEELRAEIVAEERSKIEAEVRTTAFKEGQEEALKELYVDVELVYSQQLSIDDFLAKCQGK